jgi:serine O-acetyltransferase
MILNKQDYLNYLHQDRKVNGTISKPLIQRWIFYSEHYFILKYLRVLRKLEYLTNVKKGLVKKVSYIITLRLYRKLSHKLGIMIPVNVAGYGLKMYHIGGIIVNPGVKLGNNCTLQTGVIIGQGSSGGLPVIGDDVYFAPGAKAFGKIKIGNNVVVAPNSVVIKDVPDNCVVSGVPAKIIKKDGVKVN